MDRTAALTNISGSEAPAMPPARLCDRLLEFSASAGSSATPDAVLDALHAVTSPFELNVLGAACLPVNASLWPNLLLDKSIFLHRDAPKAWWVEWLEVAERSNSAGYSMARMSLGPLTWSEMLRALDPIGADRWGNELALKYGMRDGVVCPVGGRWLITFWSPKVLAKLWTDELRVMIYAASSFAAMRLEQIIEPVPPRSANPAKLTPRELAVIRPLSMGLSPKEISERLGLGSETVRTHFKNAQAKLQAKNRTHTIAEALRRRVIL